MKRDVIRTVLEMIVVKEGTKPDVGCTRQRGAYNEWVRSEAKCVERSEEERDLGGNVHETLCGTTCM